LALLLLQAAFTNYLFKVNKHMVLQTSHLLENTTSPNILARNQILYDSTNHMHI